MAKYVVRFLLILLDLRWQAVLHLRLIVFIQMQHLSRKMQGKVANIYQLNANIKRFQK